ncbi:Uncharacterised protein [uncultured archaeon]|nr:Uncharacterised protein [uncultured archaeon]
MIKQLDNLLWFVPNTASNLCDKLIRSNGVDGSSMLGALPIILGVGALGYVGQAGLASYITYSQTGSVGKSTLAAGIMAVAPIVTKVASFYSK